MTTPKPTRIPLKSGWEFPALRGPHGSFDPPWADEPIPPAKPKSASPASPSPRRRPLAKAKPRLPLTTTVSSTTNEAIQNMANEGPPPAK